MNHLHLVSAKVWGGGEQYVYNLCAAQEKLGHTNYIVVDRKQPHIGTRYENVATVLYADLKSWKRFFSVSRLVEFVDTYNIDTLNCHSGAVSLLCALIKRYRPIVQFLFFKHNVIPRKTDKYHLWIEKSVDYYICVSTFVYEAQIQGADTETIKKYVCLNPGIDISRFVNLMPQVKNSPICIGFCGRIIENKGILILLESAKQLRQKGHFIEVVLCGTIDIGFKDKLSTYITTNQMTDVVTLIEYEEDIARFYERIHIYVLPSIVKEAFGLSLVEAMASGLPVIASNSGAQGEIVASEDIGFLVEAGNVDQLTNRLEWLIMHPELRTEMGVVARKYVAENFAIETMVKRLNVLMEG